jgi:TPR repeat protein
MIRNAQVKNVPGYPLPRNPNANQVLYAREISPRVYDYGKPITEQERDRLFAQPAVRQKTVEEIALESDRVVRYQLTQASNGLPSFQFEIARRYLRGDGVETNRALGLHWLRAAVTNGHEGASNLLHSLR